MLKRCARERDIILKNVNQSLIEEGIQRAIWHKDYDH